MAKSQNPLDIHRRSERKKTLQKNKAKRLKERDFKVAETQTIQSVTQEINKLERRGKKALDNNEIKKLERLRKELKIVENKKAEDDLRRKQEREAEEAMARGGRKGGPIMRKTKEEIEAMNSQRYKYAKCSVYYDAQLNPFGAAPPGQIMLYWRHGGGKTHDFREAIDPSEPDVIVYQKERKQRQQEQQESKRDFRDRDRGDNRYYENSMRDPSVKRHPDQHQDNNRAATTTSTTRKPMHMPPPSQSHNQSRHDPSRPIPPPPPPLPPTVNSDHDDKTSEPKQAKTNKTKDTTQLALPPPSLAVQRLNRQQALLKKKLGGKGKKTTTSSANATNLLLSDIWASQEEIHHDESLEGLVEQKPTNNDNDKTTTSSNSEVMIKKKKKKPIQKDADVYDPLCPSADGYAEYRNKEQIQRSLAQKKQNKKHENDSIDNNETEQKSSSEETLQQQQQQIMIWYKDLSQNIQGPFPKEQILVWKQAGFFPPQTMIRFGVTKPFVSITILDHKDVDSGNNNDNVEEEEEQNGVDARIAALKARDSSTSNNNDINATLMEHNGDGIEARIAALKAASGSGSGSTNDAHAAVSGVDARIAALKQRESSNADTSENDHDGDNESGIEARIAALRNSLRPNNNGDSNEVGPSLPLQPQPQPQPQPQNEVAESYPTVDEIQHHHHQESIDNEPEGDIPYPVDATYPANDNGEEDLTYPVDAGYPNSNEDEVSYPTDTSYPVNDAHYGETQDNYEDVAYPTNLEYPIYDDQNNHSNNEADGDIQDNYYHVENAPNYMSPTVSNTVVMKKKNTEKKLKKKTYSGDKDIVGFVPSHLQTKKRKRILNTNSNSASIATRPTNNKSRPNPSFHKERNNSKCNVSVTNETSIITEKKNSLSDEIDDFMQEISSLK